MKTLKEFREEIQALEEAKGSFRAGYQKAKKKFSDGNKQIGEDIDELEEASTLIGGLNRALNEPSKQTKIKIKQHNTAVELKYPEDHPYRMTKPPMGHKFTKSGKIVITNEELELDESGNPIKRLNSLDFDTRSKAAVAQMKGDGKKEKLYSKQLKTIKKYRDKLALEDTE